MKNILFGAVFLSLVHTCSAAVCTTGTLASYLTLGSGGCTIGSDTLSNFETLSGTTGATMLATTDVSITPGGGSFSPTLSFATSQTAATNSLLETLFSFTVAGVPFNSSSLSLGNSSETADGAVTGIENFCAGGSFAPDGVSGCTGVGGSLLTLDGIQNMDESMLGPVYTLSVTNDFTLDGGTAGSATGGVFTDSFTAAPEPSSMLLGVLGFALVATSFGRSRKTGSKL